MRHFCSLGWRGRFLRPHEATRPLCWFMAFPLQPLIESKAGVLGSDLQCSASSLDNAPRAPCSRSTTRWTWRAWHTRDRLRPALRRFGRRRRTSEANTAAELLMRGQEPKQTLVIVVSIAKTGAISKSFDFSWFENQSFNPHHTSNVGEGKTTKLPFYDFRFVSTRYKLYCILACLFDGHCKERLSLFYSFYFNIFRHVHAISAAAETAPRCHHFFSIYKYFRFSPDHSFFTLSFKHFKNHHTVCARAKIKQDKLACFSFLFSLTHSE